jgi:hypothetical protein|tara:strand:- start:1796 stop:1978 length:183 start_codon:yes stop_codon:yes gene_type:complete
MDKIINNADERLKLSYNSLKIKSESIKKILNKAQLEGVKSKIINLEENFRNIENSLSGLN